MERYTMFMDCKAHIIKMSILLKLIYRFDVIHMKIPASSCCRNQLTVLKCTWKYNEPKQT